MNEFRLQLSQQAATFATKDDLHNGAQLMIQQRETDIHQLNDRDDRLDSRLTVLEGTITGAEGKRGEIQTNIGQIVAALGVIFAVVTGLAYIFLHH